MTLLVRSFSSLWRWGLQPALVLGILVLGYLGARGLASFRKPPVVAERPHYAPLVRVRSVERGSQPVVIEGHGSLEARTQVGLVAQVGGEVVEMHPQLRPGGVFRAGEALVRIESRDYELAVAQAHADLEATRTGLAVQRAEADAAAAEWQALHPDEPAPPLLLREPWIREIEARIEAAEARLAKAELDLERTRIRLPFDGRVVASKVDVGQVIAAHTELATVSSLGVYEIPVPVETEELGWIHVPEPGAGRAGSAAVVRAVVKGREWRIPGSVVRVEAELDARSRLAHVVVAIDPRTLESDLSLGLLPGMFVDVEIDGGTLEDVVALPRSVVRERGRVWVVEDGALRFVEPEQVWSSEEIVLVRGLGDGAQVVDSDLEVVVDGMQVRVER